MPDRLKPFDDVKSKAPLEPSNPFHAMTSDPVRSEGEIAFGPFRLLVAERLLLKDDVQVELGGRTLDTLIALATRPNEVISKRELLAQIWPDVVVEEGSLRFHVAALRKALGDGENGARFITTSAGRGYCFVAKVSTHRECPPPVASGTLVDVTNSLVLGQDGHVYDAYGNPLTVNSTDNSIKDVNSQTVGFIYSGQ